MLTGCITQPLQPEHDGERIPVQVEKVIRDTFVQSLELSGFTKAYQEFPILAPSPLFVEEIHVDLGEQVEKGEPLLRFSNPELATQLDVAEKQIASLEKKIAELESSLKEMTVNHDQLNSQYDESVERAQALLEGTQTGAVTALDLLEASTQLLLIQNQWQASTAAISQQVQLEQLHLQLEQAKLNLDALNRAHEQLTINAPFSGVITLKQINPQEMALPNTPLMLLANLEQIIVELNVPTRQIEQINKGNKTTIWLEGKDEPIVDNVHSLSFASGALGKQNHVQILIDNTEHLIYPNQFVKAEIETEIIPEAILVPIQAITFINEQPYVYTVKDNVAKLTSITIGQRNQDVYHVLDGLLGDEEVITLGHERVTDGSTVYIQK